MRDRLLRLLTTFAALLTLGVLLALAAYILIRGIPCLRPSLFSPVYTRELFSVTEGPSSIIRVTTWPSTWTSAILTSPKSGFREPRSSRM